MVYRYICTFISSAGLRLPVFFFFFFNDTATTEIYTLSLHDALPIYVRRLLLRAAAAAGNAGEHGWIEGRRSGRVDEVYEASHRRVLLHSGGGSNPPVCNSRRSRLSIKKTVQSPAMHIGSLDGRVRMQLSLDCSNFKTAGRMR